MAQKKLKMYSQFNYDTRVRTPETGFQESQTIQGEGAEVREMVAKSQQGILPRHIPGIYAGIENFDFPDLQKLGDMDVTEQEFVLREARQRVKELSDTLDKKRKEAITELRKAQKAHETESHGEGLDGESEGGTTSSESGNDQNGNGEAV